MSLFPFDFLDCHSRESGNPDLGKTKSVETFKNWIPAFAGMTDQRTWIPAFAGMTEKE